MIRTTWSRSRLKPWLSAVVCTNIWEPWEGPPWNVAWSSFSIELSTKLCLFADWVVILYSTRPSLRKRRINRWINVEFNFFLFFPRIWVCARLSVPFDQLGNCGNEQADLYVHRVVRVNIDRIDHFSFFSLTISLLPFYFPISLFDWLVGGRCIIGVCSCWCGSLLLTHCIAGWCNLILGWPAGNPFLVNPICIRSKIKSNGLGPTQK